MNESLGRKLYLIEKIFLRQVAYFPAMVGSTCHLKNIPSALTGLNTTTTSLQCGWWISWRKWRHLASFLKFSMGLGTSQTIRISPGCSVSICFYLCSGTSALVVVFFLSYFCFKFSSLSKWIMLVYQLIYLHLTLT